MKKGIFTLCFLITGLLAKGQTTSYYDDSNLDLTGQNLLDELANLITNTHTTFLSYTPGVWTALQDADLDPNDSSDVILIYGYNNDDSDITNDITRGVNDNGGNTDQWNREHVFPRSLGNPNLGSTGPGSDAHHIRPADVTTNSSRANRKFADGSGNAGTTADGYWYPGDEWKGDVARMMMYMYLRYEERCLPSAVGIGNTLSTDSNMIDLFLEWNVEDPVTSFEAQRNNSIENSQGNRNPFIDNPAFATSIWGGDQAQDLFGTSTDTDTTTPTTTSDALIISEYIEGSSFNKAIEIANVSGNSIDLSNYSLKRNTNGGTTWSTELSLSGTLVSGDVYVISHSSASTTLIALADLTSNSTAINFNGNDPVGLFFNDALVDVVGTFGAGSANFAANQTLVRNSDANASTTYDASEWTSFSSDTFSFLGFHDSNISNSSVQGSSTTTASLTIIFDDFSSETSWDIVDNSNTIVYSGDSYDDFSSGSSTSIDLIFNTDECYTLNFYDTFGDGICCDFGDGSYSLTSNNGGLLASGGSFTSSDSTSFCTSSTSAKSITEFDDLEASTILNITVYPNPTSDILAITGDHVTSDTTYTIYDVSGAKVSFGSLDKKVINVESLTIGLYLISINNGTKTSTKYFTKN